MGGLFQQEIEEERLLRRHDRRDRRLGQDVHLVRVRARIGRFGRRIGVGRRLQRAIFAASRKTKREQGGERLQARARAKRTRELSGHQRLQTVAGTIQKRRAEARRGPCPRLPESGRVLTCSPTRAVRKGADRGDPNGEKDEDYGENKPDHGRFAQLGLRTACAGCTKQVLGANVIFTADKRNEVRGVRTRLTRFRQAPLVLAPVRRPVENFRAGPGIIATADNPRLKIASPKKLPRQKLENRAAAPKKHDVSGGQLCPEPYGFPPRSRLELRVRLTDGSKDDRLGTSVSVGEVWWRGRADGDCHFASSRGIFGEPN